jgi:hypothetical protein
MLMAMTFQSSSPSSIMAYTPARRGRLLLRPTLR